MMRFTYQFRLSQVFATIAILGMLLGVFVSFEVAAERQLSAIAVIESFGGTIQADPSGTTWVPLRYRKRVISVTVRDPFRSADVIVLEKSGTETFKAVRLRQAISDFAYLESLSLFDTPLRSPDLAGIPSMCMLKHLEVSKSETQCGIMFLINCTALQRLTIRADALNSEQLQSLRGLRHLQQLDLSCSGLTDSDLQTLPVLPELRVLKLRETLVDGRCISHLNRFQLLEVLDLSKNATWTLVTDDARAMFSSLPVSPSNRLDLRDLKMDSLRTVLINGAYIEEQSFRALCGQPKIEGMSLAGTNVVDEWLSHFKGKELQVLNLSNTAVSKVGLAKVARLPMLRELQIVDTQVSATDLELLGAAANLRSLHLGKLDDYARLKRELTKLSQLSTIEITDRSIGEADIVSLLQLPHLNHIVINGRIRRSTAVP